MLQGRVEVVLRHLPDQAHPRGAETDDNTAGKLALGGLTVGREVRDDNSGEAPSITESALLREGSTPRATLG